jgi:hypothetical protein
VKKVSWFGVGLILVGVAMLLDRFDVFSFGWMPVLWALVAVLGLVKAIDGFGKKKSGRVFWGTFWFLFGTYSLLRYIDVVELRSYWWLPALVLMLGFSQLMKYANTPKEWHLLVPAVLLLAIGAAMVLTEFGYFYHHDVVEAIRIYWPVGLIFFGLSLIMQRTLSQSRGSH